MKRCKTKEVATMRIHISKGGRDAEKITMNVMPNDTVEDLKKKIRKEKTIPQPIPASVLSVYYRPDSDNRHQLTDGSNTLSSYGIQHDSELTYAYSQQRPSEKKCGENDCIVCMHSIDQPSVHYLLNPSDTDGLKVAIGKCGHKVGGRDISLICYASYDTHMSYYSLALVLTFLLCEIYSAI